MPGAAPAEAIGCEVQNLTVYHGENKWTRNVVFRRTPSFWHGVACADWEGSRSGVIASAPARPQLLEQTVVTEGGNAFYSLQFSTV